MGRVCETGCQGCGCVAKGAVASPRVRVSRRGCEMGHRA